MSWHDHRTKRCRYRWDAITACSIVLSKLSTPCRWMELWAERAEMYATAVRDKGAPLDNCVGFMDCSKIQMSRPGGNGSVQRSCYSGNKRMHCLINQTITTPDGLIFHLYGPEVGRSHGLTLLRNSGIESTLEQYMVINSKQYCIYGDSAYMLRAWLQTAFPRLIADAVQALYNTNMSAMREAVEWSYKDVKQMWSSQDF